MGLTGNKPAISCLRRDYADATGILYKYVSENASP
jgi:hypothetical protein